MPLPTNTALSFNAQTSKLSVDGKPIATTNYVDEKIAAINVTNPPFTTPIVQTMKTGDGTDKGNLAFGNGALSNYLSNDIGRHNTAIGHDTLKNSTTGGKNTALGDETLVKNTTGSYNTGLGKNAFWGNTEQHNNTGVGHNAAFEGAAGDNNTIVGASSCQNRKIGGNNSTLGAYALINGCGEHNVAVGYNAGSNSNRYNDNINLTNNRNTFLGSSSNLFNNNNTFSNSTAIGYNSQITASNEIVLGTSTETVRIPKFTTAGVVRSNASGNLSSTGLIVAADITDAAITNDKLALGIDKSKVGLENVNNTSDTAKPVSTLTQSALDAKAPIDSPGFTGTVSGITKAMVGLGSVDNTSDTAKPISTLTQSALDAKAPLANPVFTGTVSGITKAMVGLGAVDNTSDLNKPISTLTQNELTTINNTLRLSYKNKILNTDQTIYADGKPGSVISGTPDGWGFSNPDNDASKINWYYFSKQRSGKSIKVKELSNMYCVITQLSNTDMENPFFVLYTTVVGSTSNAASWYRTKLFYGSNALPENVDKSKPILLYTGTDNLYIHPEIQSSNRQQLQLNSSLCNPPTITDTDVSSSTDEINLISLQTSSQQVSYNKYNFISSELGLKSSLYSETNICVTDQALISLQPTVQSALDAKADKTELNVMPTTQPQSPVTGAFWFDNNNGLLKVYSGSGWLSFSPV